MLDRVHQETLPNGVRVITSSMANVESATFGIWAGVGARYEPRRLAGVSHFIEHLLFKGTRKRSARDISVAIEGRGGYLNAFTQEESTCYYARVASNRVRAGFEVLTDMYLNSRFARSEIEKERGVIIEETMMYRDQPHHVVQEMLASLLWKGHPAGCPVIGHPAALRRMTRGEIMDFMKRKYTSGNTVVAFAGNVDPGHCVDWAAERLGRLPARKAPTCRMVTRSTPQAFMALQGRDVEQAHVAMGIRLFGRHDRRRYTLKLLSAILGENMSSRLFQMVRERHGLAYAVHSSIHLYEDTGALVITAGLDKARVPKALELTVRELNRLRDRPVGAGELKRAKDYVIGQMRLALESTSHQMLWLGENVLTYGRFMPPDRAIAALSAVTADDIQALARTVLKRSRLSFSLVAPESTLAGQAGFTAILKRMGV